MTSKELKRLSRADLLEMLLDLSKENDRIRKENESLRKKLEDRNIAIENCGSLAEAALQLNGVFQAAQEACLQYTENIRLRSENVEEHCRRLEQQTKQRCEAMLDQARQEAKKYMEQADKSRSEQDEMYAWLAELMNGGEKK